MNSWNSPSSWSSGVVPGPGNLAVVDRDVVLSGAVSVAGVKVLPGASLTFDPAATSAIITTRNVVVEGRLVMRPISYAVTHRITFTGIREADFVGGGMDVVESDVGLWVVGDGVLDAVGSERVGWTRAGWDPTWRDGDDVRLCPTAKGDYSSFVPYRRGQALPVVQWRGRSFPAETINLTRNVVIEGTGDGSASPSSNGRAHVIFQKVTGKQTLRNVLVRNVGPRKAPGVINPTDAVLGRWAIHFHHCDDGSRGSLIENVVVQDCGSHAFVAHSSNGVTFRQCVSFRSWESAYWWDPDDTTSDPGHPKTHQSDDVTYDRCLAALVLCDPPYRGFRASGFELGFGQRNRCIGCVAVGVQGTRNAAGFQWPEAPDARQYLTTPREYAQAWEFDGCVSHNNAVDGAFVWQNSTRGDLVTSFAAYRNGNFGWEHGAYVNNFHFDGSVGSGVVLFDNGKGAISCQALSHGSAPDGAGLRFTSVVLDGGGSPALTSQLHIANPGDAKRVMMRGCEFLSTGTAVVIRDNSPASYGFVACKVNGRELAWSDFSPGQLPASSYVIQDSAGKCSSMQVVALPDGSLG